MKTDEFYNVLVFLRERKVSLREIEILELFLLRGRSLNRSEIAYGLKVAVPTTYAFIKSMVIKDLLELDFSNQKGHYYKMTKTVTGFFFENPFR